jgi:O-antigen/teichoic acid export membrane protein
MLLVPATIALIVLSKPMISTLFGDQGVYAPVYFALYFTSNLLVIFGSLSITSILTGLGQTTLLMKLSGISLLLRAHLEKHEIINVDIICVLDQPRLVWKP